MCHLFQKFEKRAADDKLWFELGRNVGLEVVNDEKVGAEEEQMEEDREVQKIVDQRRAVKRKKLTGTCMYVLCMLKASKHCKYCKCC